MENRNCDLFVVSNSQLFVYPFVNESEIYTSLLTPPGPKIEKKLSQFIILNSKYYILKLFGTCSASYLISKLIPFSAVLK